jgi:hypothetical protein
LSCTRPKGKRSRVLSRLVRHFFGGRLIRLRALMELAENPTAPATLSAAISFLDHPSL